MLSKAKGLAGLLAAAALFAASTNVAFAADYAMTGTDPLSVRADRQGGNVMNDDNSKSKSGSGTGSGSGSGSKDKGKGKVAGTQSGSRDCGSKSVSHQGNTMSGTNSGSHDGASCSVSHDGDSKSKDGGNAGGGANNGGANNGGANNGGANNGGANNGGANNGGANTGGTVAGQQQAPASETQYKVVWSYVIERDITLVVHGRTYVLPAGTLVLNDTLGTGAVLPSGETVRISNAMIDVLGQAQAPAVQAPAVQAPAVSAPADSMANSAVAGSQQSGQANLGISNLPSTSSLPAGLPLGALGASAAAAGIYLLRRKR